MASRERSSKSEASSASPDPFAELYPKVARWVQDGWVEIGRDDSSRSMARALDRGGMVWEGERSYATPHEALAALDAGIAEWLGEHG